MLTIAIPTFNRSAHLERQLRWLSAELPGHEDRVSVVISDNASTDDTPAVVDAWRPAFANADFTYRRNPTNIGAVGNIASCIRGATRRHVWTIGDDDVFEEGLVAVVLAHLGTRPDLGLLTLNFSSRNVLTGVQRFTRCYPVPDDLYDPQGTRLFSYCLDLDEGGVALTSAQIYASDLARQAQREWTGGDNLMVQIYWSAFCAVRGGMLLTSQPHLECAAGAHYFSFDPVLYLRLHFVDTPALSRPLAALGVDERVRAELALKQLAPAHRGPLVAGLRSEPWFTLRTLAAFASWLWRAGPLRTMHFVGRKFWSRWRHRGEHLDRGRPTGSHSERPDITVPTASPLPSPLPSSPRKEAR